MGARLCVWRVWVLTSSSLNAKYLYCIQNVCVINQKEHSIYLFSMQDRSTKWEVSSATVKFIDDFFTYRTSRKVLFDNKKIGWFCYSFFAIVRFYTYTSTLQSCRCLLFNIVQNRIYGIYKTNCIDDTMCMWDYLCVCLWARYFHVYIFHLSSYRNFCRYNDWFQHKYAHTHRHTHIHKHNVERDENSLNLFICSSFVSSPPAFPAPSLIYAGANMLCAECHSVTC